MSIANDIQPLHAQMREWRQHLHRFPETAFEETKQLNLLPIN